MDAEIEKEFFGYSDTLENIGYRLIPRIREENPGVTLVGTSSMDKMELSRFPNPDASLSKTWEDAEGDLRKAIMRE